jgi:hypothetical protein
LCPGKAKQSVRLQSAQFGAAEFRRSPAENMRLIKYSLIALIYASCFHQTPVTPQEVTKSELAEAKANWTSLEQAINRTGRKDSFLGKKIYFEGWTSAHWVYNEPKKVQVILRSELLCIVDFSKAYTEPKYQWQADNYSVFVIGIVTSVDRFNRVVGVRGQYAGVLSSQ